MVSPKPSVSVSIVSHAHGNMVSSLVQQLLGCPQVGQVLVTCNVPEELDLSVDPRVVRISNLHTKGFSANHNAAFALCTAPWFVVLNPDVVLKNNPFQILLDAADKNSAFLLSPQAVASNGKEEDCWRYFPTPWSLLRKMFGGPDGRYSLHAKYAPAFKVDWASGLCLFVHREAYVALEGFDERYFLYYEDVDFCARAWRAGLPVWACPAACLIHNAQRASRLNVQHLCWHLKSMLRYFLTQSWRLPRTAKR